MAAGRRVLIGLLLFALVMAQALGLMHRVVHAPVIHAAPQAHANDYAQGHAHGWVAHLFAGHHDDSTCRLFDPLNHDGAPTVAMVVLPLLLTSFFLDFHQGEFLARWVALFQARGPPSPR